MRVKTIYNILISMFLFLVLCTACYAADIPAQLGKSNSIPIGTAAILKDYHPGYTLSIKPTLMETDTVTVELKLDIEKEVEEQISSGETKTTTRMIGKRKMLMMKKGQYANEYGVSLTLNSMSGNNINLQINKGDVEGFDKKIMAETDAKGVTKETTILCGGCLYADECLAVGEIREEKYCSKAKEMSAQKNNGKTCEEDYECLEDTCVQGECVKQVIKTSWIKGFFKSIGDFITSLFQKAGADVE